MANPHIFGVSIPKIQIQEIIISSIGFVLIYMATIGVSTIFGQPSVGCFLMADSGEAVLHLLTTLTSEGILTKDPVGNVRTGFGEKDRCRIPTKYSWVLITFANS